MARLCSQLCILRMKDVSSNCYLHDSHAESLAAAAHEEHTKYLIDKDKESQADRPTYALSKACLFSRPDSPGVAALRRDIVSSEQTPQ